MYANYDNVQSYNLPQMNFSFDNNVTMPVQNLQPLQLQQLINLEQQLNYLQSLSQNFSVPSHKDLNVMPTVNQEVSHVENASAGHSATGPSSSSSTASKGSKGSKGRSRQAIHFSLEEISQYFSLPVTQAAKELGVCTTVLKKVCRRHGINRWPQRKLTSLNKSLKNIQESSFGLLQVDSNLKSSLESLQKKTEVFVPRVKEENYDSAEDVVQYPADINVGAPAVEDLLQGLLY